MKAMDGKRVVIDTNCLLQMLGRRSAYHALWRAFVDERFTLCLSNEILSEYEEILAQKASALAAHRFVQVVLHSPNILRKEPYYRFRLIEQDSDDNKFVDCAIVSAADYIVTEDAHFRVLKDIPFPAVRVIGLEEFYRELFPEV